MFSKISFIKYYVRPKRLAAEPVSPRVDSEEPVGAPIPEQGSSEPSEPSLRAPRADKKFFEKVIGGIQIVNDKNVLSQSL